MKAEVFVESLPEGPEKERVRGLLRSEAGMLMGMTRPQLLAFGIPEAYAGAAMADFQVHPPKEERCFLNERGVFISGNPGRGKTHLAVALFKADAHRFSLVVAGHNCIEPSARFETAAMFVRRYGDAMRRGESEEMFREYAETRLLILDDLGAENRSDWSSGLVAELLDARLARQLTTIVTSNLDAEHVVDYDPRLASRLEALPHFSFCAEDYNWRTGGEA